MTPCSRLCLLALAAALAAAGGCASAAGGARGGSTVEYVAVAPEAAPAVVVARPVAEVARPEPAPAEPKREPRRPVVERPAEEPASAEVRGASHLARVAPALRARGLALYRRLEAEGIHVRFIFGYTPYTKRSRKGPGGWATWHQFGLAFDLNLVDRKGMGDAKKHFAEDAEIWARIGAVAQELGLVWGGSWRSSYDPFHFEWHPGDDAVINKQDLARFLRAAGKRGKDVEAVWRLYGDDTPPEM